MSDQCKNCTARGDLDKCLSVPCGNHENWAFKQIWYELGEAKTLYLEYKGSQEGKTCGMCNYLERSACYGQRQENEQSIKELGANAAFYKSCALSGEIPKDGDEPYPID